MLPEKIYYPHDFPLTITIAELNEVPLHYHLDVELVVVLQGSITLKSGSCTYTLPKGSIFANNGREVHGFWKTDDSQSTIAVIQFNTAYFAQYFPRLSKSTYRTFALRETDTRFDRLREKVLTLLSLYMTRGIDYKQHCIEESIHLIDFLNENFNLFSFDEGLVVSPAYDNLVMIERMSRIIPYIYEHHEEKITLEDLAEIEHLSTYYISHMMKDCLGLNFREFLSFSRVEFSEMMLLQTDEKIHTIARRIGFSTTAYYEKFFLRWFGKLPVEHREHYASFCKSPTRPEKLGTVNNNAVLSMVQQQLSVVQSRHTANPVRQQKLYVRISATERTRADLKRELIVDITQTDLQKFNCDLLSSDLPNILEQLGCNQVILTSSQTEAHLSADQILTFRKQMTAKGITLVEREKSSLQSVPVYGLDSIANMVHVFQSEFLSSRPRHVKLMDGGDSRILLKGDSGLLTASGLFKPAYYAHLILSKFQGELIAYDPHYVAIRTTGDRPCYLIAVLNYNDSTSRICTGAAALGEVQEAIERYRDELELNISLYGLSGTFFIKKYSFDHSDTLFDFLERIGFPKEYDSPMDFDLNYYTAPKTDVFTEDVDQTLHLNFSVIGTGLQMAVVESLPV